MAQKKYTEEEARERKNARQREYAKRTGYDAQGKYNEKTYTQIVVSVKKETAVKYKEKCKELNVSYSQPLHDAIEKFIEDN